MTDKPVQATKHCRHYDYKNTPGSGDYGPSCALGFDLTAPGAWRRCAPDPDIGCASRSDYTDEERAAWSAYRANRLAMIPVALAAFKEHIGPGEAKSADCPHCAGMLTVARASNGHAWLICSNRECVGPVHFNIDRRTAWPPLNTESEPTS
ncbi:hypothetical protein [Breoghania sp.]|uniref:hypothetical protein n=1 Tax=Breoghania sp. TaxID=2065378 RepID=UPI002AA6318C|nr:hypothetical protein [Breoghania sp.]